MVEYRFFETHIHFGSESFKSCVNDQVQLESRFQYLNVSTSLSESYLVVEQSKAIENVACSVGVHPLYISSSEIRFEETISELTKLIERNNKIVAIGECGLDFYKVSKEEASENQFKWLKAQLEISEKFNLPTILHLRGAYKEAIELLKGYPLFKGIIHSFGGTVEELKSFLQLPGKYYISFSPLVFRNFSKFKEIIALVPDERILVESDAPFLGLGSSICRSLVRVISEIKCKSFENMRDQIYKNSLRVFNLNSEE